MRRRKVFQLTGIAFLVVLIGGVSSCGTKAPSRGSTELPSTAPPAITAAPHPKPAPALLPVGAERPSILPRPSTGIMERDHKFKGPPPAEARIVRAEVPPPNPAPTDEDLLAESIAKLKKGNMAYSTPQSMKMGHTEHVTAKIGGPEISADGLKSGLDNGANRTVSVAATPVTSAMKMTLKSADFDITPLSSEEQLVGGDTPTTWEWDILPKHSGELRLHLAAVILVNNLSKDFTTIDRDIAVQVNTADAITAFMQNNWQWLIATATTLGGALWKYLHSQKKKSTPSA